MQWELFREEKSAAEGGDRDAYGDPMLSLPQIILLIIIILLIQMMMILLIQMMMIIIVIRKMTMILPLHNTLLKQEQSDC